MTIIGIHSVSALKRALAVGADVHVTNYNFPRLNGYRTVLKRTTRSVMLSFPEGQGCGDHEGSWVEFPPAANVRFVDNAQADFFEADPDYPWLSLRPVQLTADDGEEITQYYGCECDLDAPCNVPECLMRRDFEQRRMARWYNNQRAMGADPLEEYRNRFVRPEADELGVAIINGKTVRIR